MRIGIDARPLIEKKTGIGFYLYYLLINILENDRENEYILFSDRTVYFDSIKYDNLQIVVDKDSKLKKSLWYLLRIRKLCAEYETDVFWGTQHVLPFNMTGVKSMLTVHDLVAFDFKETMSFYNKFLNLLLIPRSIKNADKIIAVSKSTAERLRYHFNKYSKDKIKVIYEDVVVDKDYSSIDSEYLTKCKLCENKYIMFLGTIEPRKNIITLINALDKINKETGMKLLICGKYGWNCDIEKKLIEENKDKIVFLNYVTDSEKNYLMNKAFAFVFPSLYEGFGLPVLEALRNNTISIVADNTSLKELIEEESLRFKTLDSEELANKIILLYKDKELYRRGLEYCSKREKDFEWNDISKEYINQLCNI